MVDIIVIPDIKQLSSVLKKNPNPTFIKRNSYT